MRNHTTIVFKHAMGDGAAPATGSSLIAVSNEGGGGGGRRDYIMIDLSAIPIVAKEALHIALDKVFPSLSITEEVMGVRARTGFRGLVSMGPASLYTGIP